MKSPWSLLFSLLFLLTPLFFAQSIKAEELNYRIFCPRSVKCDTDGSKCSGKGDLGHRVRIYSEDSDPVWKKPLAGKATYIVECFGITAGSSESICTTAKSSLDNGSDIARNGIYARDNYSLAINRYNYKFDGMFAADGETAITQPLNTNTGKLSSIEWQSSTPDEQQRVFYGLNPVKESDAGSCQSGPNISQCLLKFIETQGVCNSIRWDPYGRVFDSQSLEPVMGARVTLYKVVNPRGPNPTPTIVYYDDPLVPNNITTKNTGDFNFVVPNGTYRLSVLKDGKFNFPFNPRSINRNYSRAYSDIYYATVGAFMRQDIVQSGGAKHVDIPIDAVGAPYISTPEIVNYFVQVDRTDGNYLDVQGRVTHPFTIIKAFNSATNVELAVTSADKLGNFEIKINQAATSPLSGCCRLEPIKVDLNRISTNTNIKKSFLSNVVGGVFSFLNVSAQNVTGKSIDINPIPSFIQGYAYGGGGKIIPNAKVGVYFTFSNKALYETTADTAGFFKISSSRLPNLPYELRFTSPGGAVTKKTTSKFIVENQGYFVEKNVDLFSLKSGGSNINPSISPSQNLNPPSITGSQAKVTGSASNTNNQVNILPSVKPQASIYANNSAVILIVAVLLALIGIVGSILFFYILKKRRETSV